MKHNKARLQSVPKPKPIATTTTAKVGGRFRDPFNPLGAAPSAEKLEMYTGMRKRNKYSIDLQMGGMTT